MLAKPALSQLENRDFSVIDDTPEIESHPSVPHNTAELRILKETREFRVDVRGDVLKLLLAVVHTVRLQNGPFHIFINALVLQIFPELCVPKHLWELQEGRREMSPRVFTKEQP
jgi:hypothetical protein